jgi:ATP-dependent DNA ligase
MWAAAYRARALSSALMSYPIEPPVEPMLAALEREIPAGDGWIYEPKWDGFRAIIFRDGEHVHIGSRNQLPLERYFPEVVDACCRALPERCVIDSEIVIEGENGLEFDALQLRLHPAESRVRKLAAEIPATVVAFDLLAIGDRDLRAVPFVERRALLERNVEPIDEFFLTPQTADPAVAAEWFERFEGAGLDGVMAKRAESAYVERKRVMVKVKHQRTADVVVVGYRMGKDRTSLGSLLLGLYDDAGEMHHVGFTAAFSAAMKPKIHEIVRAYETGDVIDEGPRGGSRWSAGKDQSWVVLRPELVCEVTFDHFQGDRFRHGAHFLRWRPDRDARDCTYAQFEPPAPFSLADIRALSHRS